MLRRLSKTTFRMVIKKCEFFKKEVSFLGFIIRINEVRIDLEKIKLVKD